MTLPIVFINGWAMPDSVTEPLTMLLKRRSELILINLPGLSLADQGQYDLESLIESVNKRVPDSPFLLMGWSYGGSLATAYASSYPKKVRGVITLATNPCFIKSRDWCYGMAPDVFYDFVNGIERFPQKTLKQFAALCSMNSNKSRPLTKSLAKAIQSVDINITSLLSTLGALGQLDLRPYLENINCPSMHFFGRKDALVPSEAARANLFQNLDCKTGLFEGGHCFFLDNLAQVEEGIIHFRESLDQW